MLQKAISNFAVTGCAVTAFPATLATLQGIYNGDADCYIQIHDAISAPIETAVPIWSNYIYHGVPFEFKFSPADLKVLKGIYVCYSSTAATKTLVTGVGNTGNIIGMVSEYEKDLPAGYSTAGDLTTGVNGLEVWVTGNGPKRLLRVGFINGDAATRYLMLFACTIGVAGSYPIPISQWEVVNGGTLSLSFGVEGRWIKQTIAGTEWKGCLLYVSTTAGSLTACVSAAHNIMAYYI